MNKTLVSFAAGLWLIAVGLQALSHLVRYGLISGLPDRLALIDFTPQYSVLAGLVIVTALARRFVPDRAPVEKPKRGGK